MKQIVRKMNFIDISKNIKILRIHKDFRQEDLALKSGLSRYRILALESGKEMKLYRELKDLCKALECESKDILGF